MFELLRCHWYDNVPNVTEGVDVSAVVSAVSVLPNVAVPDIETVPVSVALSVVIDASKLAGDAD